MNEKTLNKNTKAVLIEMLMTAKNEATANKITAENVEFTYKKEMKNAQNAFDTVKQELRLVKQAAKVNQGFINAVNEYNNLPFYKRATIAFPTTPES